ncbi:MAG: radical SAM protein [Elusimicrobiota bacterium]
MAKARLSAVLVGLRYHDYYRHTLSLGYLKAYADSLRELKGLVRTTLLEHSVQSKPDVVGGAVLEEEPDVVGFSCYLWNMARVAAICRELKKDRPGLRIVLGGPEVSVRAAAVLRDIPEADVVVRGEGEVTFAEILKAWARGRSLGRVPGLAYREAGRPVETPERPLIEDLSVIPSPYLDGTFEIREDDACLALETSRGCPKRCRYCDWHNGQKTRWFPKERAVREVEAVHRQATGMYYFVTDADVFSDKGRAAYLLEEFDRATGDASVHWHFQTNLTNIDEDLARSLDSLKFSLGAGVETIQPKALKRMARGFSLRGAERSLRNLRKLAPQASTHLQLIHGLPDDDAAGYRRSLEWVLAKKPKSMFLPRALALPGAEYGRHPEIYGITRAQKEPPYRIVSTESFSEEDIEKCDWLTIRVLTVHKYGPVRRALETVGEVGRPQDSASVPRTPWVDMYERVYRHMDGGGDVLRLNRSWYASYDALGKVMVREPVAWEGLAAEQRLKYLESLAAFTRAELEAAGRSDEWPALRHFFRSQESRVLWDRVLGVRAFRPILLKLLGGVRFGSGRMRWMGWEKVEGEQQFCRGSHMIHVLSTIQDDTFEICQAQGSGHIHLEETRAERWERLFPSPGRPFEATVLSNVYRAIPPSLRVLVLRWLRERNPVKDGRLVMWMDSVGLADLEFIGRRGQGSGEPDKPAEIGAHVARDLREAGWELSAEPVSLSAAGKLNKKVTWTFFQAVPAGGGAPEKGRKEKAVETA